MSVWRIVAYYCLPMPLVLFFLLSIPLPKNLRRGVLIFIQRVFDLPLIGVFKLLHLMLFATCVALLGSVRQVNYMRQLQETAVFSTPNMEIGHLSKRWRAERNLWMSAFAFCAWLMLAAFYREAVRRLQLQERWEEMEKAAASEATTAPTEARGVEVSSRPTPAAAAVGAERKSSTPPSPNKTEPAPLKDVLKNPVSEGVQMTELKKEL